MVSAQFSFEPKSFVRICSLPHLSSHTRFTIILRTLHPPITYHTLLLFRLSPVVSHEAERELVRRAERLSVGLQEEAPGESPSAIAGLLGGVGRPDVQLYCMESTCPHLGAPLSHAELTGSQQIEESHPCAGFPSNNSNTLPPVELDLDLDPDQSDPFAPELLSINTLSDPSSYTLTDTPLREEEKRTIICPWHLYDFDLEDGASSTGMGVCVYRVELRRNGRSGVGKMGGSGRAKLGVELEGEVRGTHGRSNDLDEWDVWVEGPEHEVPRGPDRSGWEIVSVTGVSEEFADPPSSKMPSISGSSAPILASTHPSRPATLFSTPLPDLPKTLVSSALLILQTASANQKLDLTRMTLSRLRTGGFSSIKATKGDIKAASKLFEPLSSDPSTTALDRSMRGEDMPGWPGHFVPPREQGVKTVDQAGLGKRGKGGHEKSRILMLHALANIEQWAIDLSWDIIARFADFSINGEKLPVEFFLDWAKVAEDEAKHFSLLSRRLEELGSFYGAHTVHAGLWTTALETSQSLLSRLAIIHLVAEARGLDVNPLTIEKFRKAGDEESVRVLGIIHNDEITHVTTGHRWFTWICQRMDVDPINQFRAEVRHNFRGRIKGPFNRADRLTAGMSDEYYEDLEGHMRFEKGHYGKKGADGGVAPEDAPEGRIGSEEGDLRIHPRLT